MPGGRGSPQGCGGRSRQAGVVGPTSKDRTDSKRPWNLQGIGVGPYNCRVYRIDCTRILENLWVGSYPQTPEDILHLKQSGITAVLSLQSDDDLRKRATQWGLWADFYRSQGIRAERVPIRDFDPPALLRHLPEAVEVLDELIRQGHTAYVHCTVGLNRSPTVAIAWMMKARAPELSPAEAVDLFSEKRHCVPYEEVLERWAQSLG